jgi:hypothetical protein
MFEIHAYTGSILAHLSSQSTYKPLYFEKEAETLMQQPTTNAYSLLLLYFLFRVLLNFDCHKKDNLLPSILNPYLITLKKICASKLSWKKKTVPDLQKNSITAIFGNDLKGAIVLTLSLDIRSPKNASLRFWNREPSKNQKYF